MLAYTIRRIFLFIPVLIIVGLIVFSIIRFIPGDPALVMLGDQATAEDVEALRKSLGLDEPFLIQLINWFINAIRGDLGISIFFNESVIPVIIRHIEPTFHLVWLSMLMTLIIAIPLGIFCGVKNGSKLDSFFMGAAFFGVSMPQFWTGLMLILIFAMYFQWLPPSGYSSISDGVMPWLSSIILPSLALGVSQVGVIARMLRFTMIEVLQQDYIRTAKAKGINKMRIILIHALPNTLIPVITIIGNSIALLLAGGIIIETVFNIRGLGWLTVNAVLRRDFPLVQGCILFVAVVYSVVNLLVDLSYGLIDPKIRY